MLNYYVDSELLLFFNLRVNNNPASLFVGNELLKTKLPLFNFPFKIFNKIILLKIPYNG